MAFDLNQVIRFFPILMLGLQNTIIISALSTVGSVVIGVIVGLMRISKNKFIYGIASVYVEWVRGTPLLTQLLFIFFGIGSIINLSAWVAGVLGLSLFTGAYVAEIVRAGIQSVPKGQTEAALSLGMNYYQYMRYIIFPQALRVILPPICSQFITLIKDSSLISVIAISDLTYMSRKIVTRNMAALEIYLTVGLMYLVLTTSLSFLVRRLERRLNRYA